jgi:hypothetical protein
LVDMALRRSLATAFSLVSLALAAPSPESLNSDLTILVNNDLQGL